MNWFRWYTGTATDPKFMVVARLAGQNVAAVVAVWAMLLERASDVSERDETQCNAEKRYMKRGFVSGFDCEAADAVLGLEDGASEAIMRAMEKKGLLTGERVTNWEKRQPKREDNSTERVRRFREKKKSETQCNAEKREETLEESIVDNINIPPTLSERSEESVSPTGDPAPPAEKPKRASSASVSRKPPTPEEVQAYCDERGNGLVDAERFCDYYAAQGWRLSNGQPLRDWKAAVRTWESREKERRLQAQHVPRASTVGQQRQQERQIQARMLLADREQRRQTEERNAQGQRYVTDSDGTKLALPPGW